MAQTIKLKRSAVQGKVPQVQDLALGEVAINTYDGALYIKRDNNTEQIIQVGADVIDVRYEHGLVSTNGYLSNTATPNQVIDGFDKNLFSSAKYFVSVQSGSDRHTSEIVVMHDGLNSYLTEYAKIHTNIALGVYDTAISGDFVQLLFSPVNTNSTIKLFRHLLNN